MKRCTLIDFKKILANFIILIVALSSNAFSCSCDSAVISAYMEQISKEKAYYSELQKQIQALNKEIEIYNKLCSKELTRTNNQLSLEAYKQEQLRKEIFLLEKIQKLPMVEPSLLSGKESLTKTKQLLNNK